LVAAQRLADEQQQAIEPSLVSLVRTADRMVFVVWTKTGAAVMDGQNIDVDENNKAVSQCGWCNSRNFIDSTILIHQVPIEYGRRFPKALRPVIPDWCMLIYAVEQARCSPGPYVISARTINRLSCLRCAVVKDLNASFSKLPPISREKKRVEGKGESFVVDLF
jgi:hypothetical protein